MSGLGAGHVRQCLWNPVRNLDMSDFSENFGLEIVFDDLHFINSPNVSPLIVQSSYDTNKIKSL
jgi:hypothetical protein